MCEIFINLSIIELLHLWDIYSNKFCDKRYYKHTNEITKKNNKTQKKVKKIDTFLIFYFNPTCIVPGFIFK